MKKEEDKEKEQKEQRFTVRQTYTGDKWMCIDEKTGVFCTFETGCFMSAEYTIPEGTYDEYLVKKLMESFLYKNYYIIAYKQRFTLKQHNTKSTSKWICIDEKTGVSCKFDTGCFLTAKYTIPVWMGKASHIKKQMSEFLHKNYCSIAFKAIAESNETKEKKKEKIKEEATETKTTKRKQKQRFSVQQGNSNVSWICIDEKTGASCKFTAGDFASGKYTIPVWTTNEETIKKQMEAFLSANYYGITYDDALARRIRMCQEIQRTRIRRNLTPKKVAKEAGLSVVTYRQIEAGEISIDLDTFIKIAEAIRMLVWLKPMRVIQYPENKALLSEIDTE